MKDPIKVPDEKTSDSLEYTTGSITDYFTIYIPHIMIVTIDGYYIVIDQVSDDERRNKFSSIKKICKTREEAEESCRDLKNRRKDFLKKITEQVENGVYEYKKIKKNNINGDNPNMKKYDR